LELGAHRIIRNLPIALWRSNYLLDFIATAFANPHLDYVRGHFIRIKRRVIMLALNFRTIGFQTRAGGGLLYSSGMKCSRILFSTISPQPQSTNVVKEENKDKAARRSLKSDLSKLSPQNVHEAVNLLRQAKWAKFDETVEIAVNLGVDPRKPNQSIKVWRNSNNLDKSPIPIQLSIYLNINNVGCSQTSEWNGQKSTSCCVCSRCGCTGC
jgi:hypothetical protein